MATKPPPLGKKIDKFFELRAERLKIEKSVSKLKEREAKIKDDLIIAMGKAGTDLAKGTKGSVSISRPEVGRVFDWPALFAWIKKTNNFEVLSRRLSQSDYADQLEQSPALAKKGIPGVEKITIVKFSASAKK
jgi:hypothetical protein